ncbi:hypothetical protein [Nesterenkonia aerolata]|uniref:Uncharacterized protein n=1 Tax=Nesterenkonia aerolata TaxID=3074079 RepID=A0ABU2DND2_9MICC|nr:hypothetical protein [Nesterenkonia sp. LY-0111]MDR8018022.1 hypothetical protein [Nesterenkonia sp. LY-0111]
MSPRRAPRSRQRRSAYSARPGWLRLGSVGVIGAVLLSGCADAPEDVDGEPDGDVAIGDPGEGIERSAPEPTGDQLSQQEMSEVLQEELDNPQIRTTDDLLESLRDVETELRRLEVDPMECQAQVLASGTPVPDGALVVSGTEGHAEEDSEDGSEEDGEEGSEEEEAGDGEDAGAAELPERSLTATLYSYQQVPGAEGYMQAELSGLENCEEYTVTRTIDEEELETEVVSELVEVETGADEALARTLSAEDLHGERHSLAVMVRTEAQIITLVEPLEAALGEDEAEDRAQQLQDRAAEILGSLVDEDLETSEDEEEAEGEADTDGDTDGEAADGDGTEDEEAEEETAEDD